MDTETPIGKVLQVIVTEELFNYTTDFSSDSGADLKDEIEIALDIHLLVGFSYIAIGSFFLCLQMVIFYTFIKQALYLKNMAFKLMLHLGVMTSIQQLCHVITGFFALAFLIDDNFLINVIGALLQTSYMTSVAFIFLLTLNRFNVFYTNILCFTVSRRKVFEIGTMLCYIWFFIMFCFYLLPNFRFFFYIIEFNWLIKLTSSTSAVGFYIENYSVIFLLLLSFIFFMLIFGKIIYLRSFTSKRNWLVLEDLKLLIQAVINYILIVVLEFIWGYLWDSFRDHYFARVVCSYYFLFTCGSNTLLTFFILREVRREVTYIFGKKRPSDVVVKVVKLKQSAKTTS